MDDAVSRSGTMWLAEPFTEIIRDELRVYGVALLVCSRVSVAARHRPSSRQQCGNSRGRLQARALELGKAKDALERALLWHVTGIYM